MSAPAYRAYTITKRQGKDGYWLKIGMAFPHEDQEGFNILLQAKPTDGKIVLRTYKEKAKENQEVGNRSRARPTSNSRLRRPERLFLASGTRSFAPI